jgi:glycerol kinase
MPAILALDQGTTGSTALLVHQDGSILGRGYREFTQHYPRPGWVEHDPEEILRVSLEAMREALAGRSERPAGLGITNQRETVVLWDRRTLAPIGPAIVWQDRRTSERCRDLRESGAETLLRERTGLVADPYFSATKLEWLLRDKPIRRRAERGELAAGTVESWLVARLTGGAVHVTDHTNASRTLLYNLRARDWDADLLALFGVPRALLPDIVASSGTVGETDPGLLGTPLPIAGLAGDQQSALFGQTCFAPGDAKCTYGTGAFILMNTGDKPVASKSGLLTTVAWKLADGELRYALEGSAFIAGAAVQWLRDGLQFFSSAKEVEALATSVEDSGGVIVVPAFAGLGAPHWRPEARGSITGLTRGTTRAHIARATLEGIALQNVDILSAMAKDAGRALATLKVDGGAAANDLLMQFQSDVLGVEISRPAMVETTALGAAFLAGLGAGVWKDQDQIRKTWKLDRTFKPTANRDAVNAHLARWDAAVSKA